MSAVSRRLLLSAGALFGLGLSPRSWAREAEGAKEAKSTTLDLSLESSPLTLPAGRSLLSASVPASSFVSLVVRGPREALLGARAFGNGPFARAIRRAAPMEEDGLLPCIYSGLPGDQAEELSLLVDVVDPVTLTLIATRADDNKAPSARGLKDGSERARSLVGLPAPRSRTAGYLVQGPARYTFARIDVAQSLMAAFEKTRKTFDSEPIWVSDISQWNGKRPKSDLGIVRHISHEGGADVDVGLPANDTLPSNVRDHCKRVFLDETHAGCSPGTAKGIDFERLAYFIGTIAEEEEGRLVKVFVDDAYRRELIRVAQELREKGFLKELGSAALSEEGVLVASPWHMDHVHLRFSGERARQLLD